jgi:hypothetical protein
VESKEPSRISEWVERGEEREREREMWWGVGSINENTGYSTAILEKSIAYAHYHT